MYEVERFSSGTVCDCTLEVDAPREDNVQYVQLGQPDAMGSGSVSSASPKEALERVDAQEWVALLEEMD